MSDRVSRRRPGRALVVTGVVAVVLVAAFVVTEIVLRGVVQDRVRDVIVETLDLPPDQRIDVQAGGIVIPQLIVGRLDDLRVEAEDLAVAGFTGDAEAHAHGVPVRGDDTSAVGGEATIRLDGGDIENLLSQIGGSWDLLDDVEVALPGPEATFSAGLGVLGATVPLELDATPGIRDGDLVVTPDAVRVAGLELTPDDLAQAPVDLSALEGPLTVCRADALPEGLELTGAEVAGQRLVVDLRLADGALADPDAFLAGSCS